MSGPARNEALQRMPGEDTNALARRFAGGGTDATAPATARWGALTASLGVIVLDFSALKGVAGDTSPAALQSLCLEQVYAMLDRALKNGAPQADAGSAPRASAVSASAAASKPRSALTPRQQDILREAASGKSNVEIARALQISVETVKTHMQQILMRLEARNRTELVAMYQQAVHIHGRGQ
ncbi:LuxR C-terminal-related transcriptional regulator [Ralstonia solanacearum]|uniref:LuxR C-terminal-related transcriptional regulator n=1 Tax=Ralstonia solanacearum TaxID=305 RepID=A0AAW5ZL84_RALSL|nr:LuxR C-terminal-related transcriptional regulator [Ralstonia solanacearum]MBB6593311.1 response regulator transcription factor [Ralstonia solanacearum]MBB6597537.1 response regulator transcription factor [Ralstonia solanacearum]MDB0542113.1 LuxR C-terminal-related transcriptional regulator [Ralstonia solanacearum]MDB0552150.1 LuxR C-terminal-related transcriptional regulator [Ralstonia solanacearum]MDB0557049.1 LuxR C-terminal-related transcriptional regulator [Ralstonia solanacearum]